jgi:acetyl-CoA carboxylase carboxyltransferase component
MHEVRATVQGTIAALAVGRGTEVHTDTVVALIESMKMEYPLHAGVTGRVTSVSVTVGASVAVGDVLVLVEPGAVGTEPDAQERGAADGTAGSAMRADLAETIERHAALADDARPDAVAKRRARGQRTARENIADLVDPGSFIEYGSLALAAQRSRRDLDDLVERTPADGLITGIGTVDGVPTAVLSYDATVLAGTQGHFNHLKKDRIFEIIDQRSLPVVFFTEGGGGRPGDTDVPVVSGLDVMAFHLFARLSGTVPLVGIASGRCFAGNAALLGCCDVIIATEGSNIGMGGPAMIEGGGLGSFTPEQVGPLEEQVANGVVDVAVADEAEAVQVATRYLQYFAGARTEWSAADQTKLRDVVPEQRRSAYDVRAVLALLADTDSVLELRADWSPGMVTALVRIEGRPMGVVANNPMHLAGAIDSNGADKASRFLQLCDANDLPVLFLCDTPGFMVGPDAERTATVRHVSRMFVTGANLAVPFGTIILRKAYGLGAMAMAGGSFKVPLFCVAWPTGELGGMGLEGAVRLGFRDELAAVDDEAEREQLFERMVAAAYENGRALNTATILEIDDVIDPTDSRRWITRLLGDPGSSWRVPPTGRRGRRPNIDTW